RAGQFHLDGAAVQFFVQRQVLEDGQLDLAVHDLGLDIVVDVLAAGKGKVVAVAVQVQRPTVVQRHRHRVVIIAAVIDSVGRRAARPQADVAQAAGRVQRQADIRLVDALFGDEGIPFLTGDVEGEVPGAFGGVGQGVQLDVDSL